MLPAQRTDWPRFGRAQFAAPPTAVAAMCAVWLAAWAVLPFGLSEARADRIVLRNLNIISDRTAADWDEDGVRLSDGSTLRWDEIERATIGTARQADFNRLLSELGTPMFKIRQRLVKGDYDGLLEPAEAVYPRYVGRSSPAAYMVFQSLMWARLAAGRREAAVEPYLRCYEYLRHARGPDRALVGRRRLRFNAESALSVELLPVWFDSRGAKDAMPGVLKAVSQMQRPHPEGARIYYATLALTAGENETADRVLGGLQGQLREIAELREIVAAQREVLSGGSGGGVARLESSLERMLPQNKPLALYWSGMAKLTGDDPRGRREGVLRLLSLPALYGDKHPELAGAGLYQSMIALDQLDDATGSVSVRRELLVRYGHTVHAAKVKPAASGPNRQ